MHGAKKHYKIKLECINVEKQNLTCQRTYLVSNERIWMYKHSHTRMNIRMNVILSMRRNIQNFYYVFDK